MSRKCYSFLKWCNPFFKNNSLLKRVEIEFFCAYFKKKPAFLSNPCCCTSRFPGPGETSLSLALFPAAATTMIPPERARLKTSYSAGLNGTPKLQLMILAPWERELNKAHQWTCAPVYTEVGEYSRSSRWIY